MSVSTGATLTPPQKIMRECVRPFRQLRSRIGVAAPVIAPPAPVMAGIQGFHPLDCTVEPEGVDLIKTLVRESRQHPGPIIEVGTLLGVTATHMALAKAPEQKIITVDNYCWNPWGLPPDVQHDLAKQVLYYLIENGDVQQLREDKNKFFEEYDGPAPSMVFLDAMHDYVETKKDIEWAQRVGAKIIAGHDYCDKFPGVIQIVDECGGPTRLGGTVWTL